MTAVLMFLGGSVIVWGPNALLLRYLTGDWFIPLAWLATCYTLGAIFVACLVYL